MIRVIVSKVGKRIFILAFSAVHYLIGMAQNNVFVSTTGSDVVGTGSISQPFKTAAKAVQSGLLIPGSNLYFRGGVYFNPNYQNGDIWKEENTVFINNLNGTPAAYISISPYNNESVIIRGDGHMIFQIRSSSYVKINGFEIYGETENLTLADALYHQFEFKRNSLTAPVELRLPRYTNTNQAGLEDLTSYVIYRPSLYMGHGMVVQNSHHIDLFGNLVHHIPGEGIRYAGTDYIRIFENEVHNCGRRSSGGVHGISAYNQRSIDNNNGVKTLVSRNLVHDNYQEFPSWSENKTIFTATIDEGKGITLQRINGGNEWLHGRIQIDNNITYRNGFSGVHINDGLRTDIINNTSYLDCRTGQGNQIGISIQTGDDIKVYNNMVFTNLGWGGNSIGGSNMTNMIVTNNIINGGLDNELSGIAVNTIVTSDMKWSDTANRNFHLQSNSPAINNALSAVSPPIDFFNVSRGVQPDRGAVEYIGGVLPLQLLRFTASIRNETVQLDWISLNETGFDHFECEHSADGIVWSSITVVRAGGSVSGTAIYEEIHRSPIVGLNYYRLKLVDMNGAISYSQVSTVTFSSKIKPSIYPNPLVNTATISGIKYSKSIRVYDMAGNDVTSRIIINILAGRFQMDMSILPSGNYLLTVDRHRIKLTKAQ